MRKFSHYAFIMLHYASIMLYVFHPLLCQKLCRHNRRKPIAWYVKHIATAGLSHVDYS